MCGGEAAPRRHRGKLIELDLANDAAQHKKIDFQSDQICAGLLDDLPDIVADALEIAVYVYSADRLVKRATSIDIQRDWNRMATDVSLQHSGSTPGCLDQTGGQTRF